ncbi:hypothetical protein TSO352_31210 [Azospirillum sp. TSO35-2]|nr:hypothetical protein TSO352_31210 [Azospirillum sp. TSO35-2]
MKLFVRCIASAVALFAGTLALSPASAETVLNRGNGGEPVTLDPHLTDGRVESNIFRDLFEGLLVYGPDGRLLPGVAESWDVSEDGLTYSFHLRANAKWSNGDPITADDFIYSLRRAVAPHGGPAAANLRLIEKADAVMAGTAPPTQLGVTATDPATLRIRLSTPAPYFLALLSSDNMALPVHRASVEANGDRWTEPGKLVSNGAYTLAEWQRGKPLVVTRNPNYYAKDSVSIDRVVFHPVADPDEEMKLYRAGLLHVTNEVPQEQVKWISLSQPKEFWNKPYLATYYYALNLTAEPFKGNPTLRKALSLAINRQTIVEKVTRAGEMPAYGLVPPVVPNYRRPLPAYVAEPMERRLEDARRLFADAGYGPSQPLKLEILYNTSDNNDAIATAVRSQWETAFGKGLIVTTVSVDRTEYLKRRARRDFQVVRAAWIGDIADPTAFLNLMLSTAQPPRNDPGYHNAKYDALLAKAAATIDTPERAKLLVEAERMMVDDVPVLPIYHFATKSLVSTQVKGWTFNIRDVHPSRFLSIGDPTPPPSTANKTAAAF